MNQANKPPSPRDAAETRELHRVFALADRDDDGRVDFTEFRQLLDGLQAGMSEDEMRIGFQEVDTDHDGLIDRQEFIDWWGAD